MRKLAAGILIGTLAVGVPVVASAQGGIQKARYQMAEGSAIFPQRVIIRCEGWAEDSANRLRLVEFEGERVVYRCVTP